jgi:gliding motility-associated-like protein
VNLKLLFFLLLITFSSLAQNKNKTIGFKENKGQIIDQKGKPNNAVKYLLNSGGLNVQLRKNGFSYDVYEAKKHTINNSHNERKKPLPFPSIDNEKLPDYTLEYQFHRIDIDFLNSNSKVELVTEEKSLDYENYYNIPNKPEGVLMVHQYKQITYKNIYPNIDVVFSIPKDTLKTVEYNFVVHPKGKISDIQLKFSGAPTELVDNKIRMSVRFGEMEETLPASWTEDGELKKEIAIGYIKIKNNVYGFESSENVTDKTVIIDPVPVRLWGTYYGGTYLTDEPNSINFDKNGNIIFTGFTENPNGIATTGSFQSSLTNLYGSGFIAKLDSNGIRIWGTYILGGGIQSAKINSKNEIYIGGYENAVDYIPLLSTPNSFKETPDYGDALLMKFDSNGQRIWGTYYGGQEFERIDAISLDSHENIIIAGETHSKDGIATPDGYQNTSTNTADVYTGFFAKFNKDGTRLYGSYFPIVIRYSTIDSNDNIIFAGSQNIIDNSYPNISTNGAFKTNPNSYDGFIVKFSPSFTRLWCTYYGGDKTSVDQSPNSDFINGIGNDDANNIYIIGSTTSSNNISTTGAFKTSQNTGGQDAFIAKFNPNGIRQWGTYFGDNSTLSTDYGMSCFISPEGFVYIIGYTDSQNNIATTNSFQSILNQGHDSYIAKFSTNGELKWGTYYGGKGSEWLRSIDILDGKIVVSGRTFHDDSTDLSTPGTHKTNGGGFVDIFIAEFQECLSNPQASSNSPVCIGETLELKASGGTNYSWTGPNGFTSSDQNPTIPNATAINSGEYSCIITGTGGCDDTKKINVVIGDTVAPIPNLTTLPAITGDCHTLITTIPTATDACAGLITATTANPLTYSLPGTYTVVWDYDDGNNNISHQNQTVTISDQPLPTATSAQTFCIQQNATVNDIAITGQNVKWYDTLNVGNFLPNITLLQEGKTYYASQTINGCESERVDVTIKIQDTPIPVGNANQPFCSDQNSTIANILVTGQNIKWYDSLANGTLLSNTTALLNGMTYYASQTVNSCESERLAVKISIQNTPGVPTGDTNPKFCKSKNATFSNININGQNLKWYDSTTSANPLANTTLVQNNTTYYVSQTIGCESDRLAVLVNVYGTPLPIANASQTFCIDENATLNTITVTGQNLIWYDSATVGNILTNTNTLENKTYYVSQSNNNCESVRLGITVKIQDTQAPVADANQNFCMQQNATINAIKINGQNIKWYNTVTNGTNLSESSPLENGITYYASQTVNDCESERFPITIQIQEATTSDCINYVYELPFPKFFTPNNDGYNDTWTIDFIYLAPNSAIRIFDRYGKLVKQLDPNSNGWDGIYIGQPLPATDYWFVVTRVNGEEYKGHFSLNR